MLAMLLPYTILHTQPGIVGTILSRSPASHNDRGARMAGGWRAGEQASKLYFVVTGT